MILLYVIDLPVLTSNIRAVFKSADKFISHVEKEIPRNIILTNCYLTYLLKKDFDIKWVNISFRERLHGKTNYNFVSMFKLVFNLVVRFKK